MGTSYHFTNYVSEVNEQTVFRVVTSKETPELNIDIGATASLVNDKLVFNCILELRWVGTKDMVADGFTKALTRGPHESFVRMLGMVDAPRQGACWKGMHEQ